MNRETGRVEELRMVAGIVEEDVVSRAKAVLGGATPNTALSSADFDSG